MTLQMEENDYIVIQHVSQPSKRKVKMQLWNNLWEADPGILQVAFVALLLSNFSDL